LNVIAVKSGHVVELFSLAIEGFLFAFVELCGGKGSGIQIGHSKAIKLVIELLDLLLNMPLGFSENTASVMPFAFKAFDQPIGPIIGKRGFGI
jgi:hypothetical protein